VLPEGFVTGTLHSAAAQPGAQYKAGDPAPPELAPYAAVALERKIFLVCGTMMEPVVVVAAAAAAAAAAGGGGGGGGSGGSGGTSSIKTKDATHYYTTCVVLGPDGRTVGMYRKRRIHHVEVQKPGSSPLVFDAGPKIGRVGKTVLFNEFSHVNEKRYFFSRKKNKYIYSLKAHFLFRCFQL
jgi:predicted amidohydrolase